MQFKVAFLLDLASQLVLSVRVFICLSFIVTVISGNAGFTLMGAKEFWQLLRIDGHVTAGVPLRSLA